MRKHAALEGYSVDVVLIIVGRGPPCLNFENGIQASVAPEQCCFGHLQSLARKPCDGASNGSKSTFLSNHIQVLREAAIGSYQSPLALTMGKIGRRYQRKLAFLQSRLVAFLRWLILKGFLVVADMLALADRFYDAALDPVAWGDALESLAFQFNGRGVVVIDCDCTPRVVDLTLRLADFYSLYEREWADRDAALLHAIRHGIRPGVGYDDDDFSDEFRATNDFYQEFRRPLGIGGIMNLTTSPFAGSLRMINIQRSLKAGRVTPEERRKFAMIARHVSRACAIRMRLQRAEAVQVSFGDRLSDFDCAVAVVDRLSRVILSNAAFDALAFEGMAVRGGLVRVDSHKMQEQLDRLIASAFMEHRGAEQPDTLAIARQDSMLPLLMRAIPLKAATAERLLAPIPVHGVLLMVLNPSHPAYPDVTQALVALGLTPAQARVALLVAGGLSPRLAAEQLGIREDTVRTTLKNLYSRLGISRQADLARLVAKAAPFKA